MYIPWKSMLAQKYFQYYLKRLILLEVEPAEKKIGLPENDERLKLKKLHREELTDGYKKGVSVLYPQD